MTEITLPTKTDEEKADHDYQVIRGNLQELIIKGTKALDEVGVIAEQGQEARMYEVYSKLMNSLTEASRELMELHKRKHSLRDKTAPATQVTHNKNLIIASTSDVLKLVKQNLMDENNQIKQIGETKDEPQS